MSQALERVIAEQQAKIDNMEKLIDGQNKSLNAVFTRHDELFEAMARLVESDEKDQPNLRRKVRLEMMDAGWCFGCYNFVCECDHD
jgi:hypothetical protein